MRGKSWRVYNQWVPGANSIYTLRPLLKWGGGYRADMVMPGVPRSWFLISNQLMIALLINWIATNHFHSTRTTHTGHEDHLSVVVFYLLDSKLKFISSFPSHLGNTVRHELSSRSLLHPQQSQCVYLTPLILDIVCCDGGKRAAESLTRQLTSACWGCAYSRKYMMRARTFVCIIWWHHRGHDLSEPAVAYVIPTKFPFKLTDPMFPLNY